MRSLILSSLLAATLAGCAHGAVDKPPLCDGHHLRPANPYGSVLAPEMAAAASPPAPTDDTTRGPASRQGRPHRGCGR